jgi:hypothetical protein
MSFFLQRFRSRYLNKAVSAIWLLTALGHDVVADVIVVANRAGVPVQMQFAPLTGQVQHLTLPVGEVLPMFVDGQANASFAAPGGAKRYLLDANCAYYFGRGRDGRLDLQKVGLGEDGTMDAGRPLPGTALRTPDAMIHVKILADEEEPARQVVWEQRLRHRIAAASAILEKHCRVGLNVVAVDTWKSDNSITDFTESLREFEQKVDPAPATLAIGFTSQWRMVHGRVHMAGTRGPLHPHILVRVGSPEISEAEKLEFLVHELGHLMGAVHSPEPDSVMRPVLGDNRAGRSDFQIRFDPVNTLIMSMIGEELRRRDVTRLIDLTPNSKRRLGQIYKQLALAMPDDPAGMRYVQLMTTAATQPVIDGAHQVLQEIVRVAADNRALPMASNANTNEGTRRQGDALSDFYVRTAAKAAQSLPEDNAAKSFLLALGVGLDDSNLLARQPMAANLFKAIEPLSERRVRLLMIGEPTIRGQREFAQHFISSAFLAAMKGAEAAQAAALERELATVQNGGRFSFANVAADRAGVRFASGVLDKRPALGLLARTFAAVAFVPDAKGLPDALSDDELKTQYGSKDDPRFAGVLKDIDQRIAKLPGYSNLGVPLSK